MDYKRDIVRLYTEERLTERDIAKRLQLPRSTVHYWLANHVQVHPTKRQGRPRCTNIHIEDELYETTKRDPFITSNILQQQLNPGCSTTTIRRRLKERKMKCRIPAHKPFLNKMHLQMRLAFACNYFEFNGWHKVVFSDEKIFRASTRGPLRVYRPQKSDRYDPKYLVKKMPRLPNSVHVWMCFGGTLRKIHRVKAEKLTAKSYTREILSLIEEELVTNNLIYMHDNASIHTAKYTKAWLSGRNINVLKDWPTKGADMNPVENVWAELVRRIRRKSENKDQLWENILEAYNSLPDSYFTKLIDSMPRRIAEVKRRLGHWSKY